MIPIFRLVIRTTILLCPAIASVGQTWVLQASGTEASLRGISVVSEKVAWASGSGGTFLRTLDSGAHWVSSIVPGAEKLDFRGIQALNADSAILMSSGEGALSAIYRTDDAGKHWTLLLRNNDAKGFFDSIAFRDAQHGMVFGDPVDGKFVMLSTSDAGKTWNRTGFPASPEGEGAFAASNSVLVILGRDAWVATGGRGGSRVDHLPSGRLTQTPIRHDSDGAGIFSLAFSDSRHGVAVGGDYSKPREDAHNIAITEDGGLTWSEPTGTHPRGYRSAVAWFPQQRVWITTGTTGSEISRDGGQNWTPFDDGAFNALGVSANAAWAVGPKGRIAKLVFDVPAKP
jgi:photosystem II stability/assembly factor-like uncharacterized protein